MMYALFAPFWNERTALRWVHQFSTFTRIQPAIIQDLQLPQEYVAVRFYFSKCFPDTPENQALVTSLITSLAADTHVVVLGSGTPLDEHRDVEMARSNRVHTVAHLLRPETNLAVQTAVIGGARAFIGTYGGFSYLAPLCGVDSVALYSRRNYYPHHLYLAQQVFDAVAGGSLTVMDAGVCPLTRHLAIASSRSAPPA
jgi:ADP-heptose:LPS heptosyltransferase